MHKWRDGYMHQTAVSLITAAADVLAFDFPQPVRIFEFCARVTTAIVLGTTDSVFSLDVIDHDGSTRTEKCTLTQSVARAVGHRDYIKLEAHATFPAFDVQPGQQLVIEHKVAGAGGSIAGAVKLGFKYAILSDANRHATYDHAMTA